MSRFKILPTIDEDYVRCQMPDDSLKGDKIKPGKMLIFQRLDDAMKEEFKRIKQFNMFHIYAVSVNDEVIVRHLQIVDNYMILMPSNELYKPFAVDPDVEAVKIIGVLIHVV